MAVNDPIGDMLTRIRNAQLRRRPKVVTPASNMRARVLDVLVRKTGFALARFPARSLGLSGGVANNRGLRTRLAALAEAHGAAFLPALPRHTGDNAGMIAFSAWIDPGPTQPDAYAWSIEPSLALDARPGTT